MSDLSMALMCAGLIPIHARKREMNITTLALMCAGEIPIPRARRPDPDADKPRLKRNEKMRARRDAIFDFVERAGRKVTSAEIRAEFGICKNMALKDLFALRDSGRIESSKARDGTTWLYEARK